MTRRLGHGRICYNSRNVSSASRSGPKDYPMLTAPLCLSVLRRPVIVLIAVVALLPLFAATPAGGDIAVVVRPDTPADNLSFNDIRKLLLGERQFWNSSLRVTLLIRAPSAHERDVVLKTIYRMSETQFR